MALSFSVINAIADIIRDCLSSSWGETTLQNNPAAYILSMLHTILSTEGGFQLLSERLWVMYRVVKGNRRVPDARRPQKDGYIRGRQGVPGSRGRVYNKAVEERRREEDELTASHDEDVQRFVAQPIGAVYTARL